jgi:hypothetical protein
VTHAGVWTLLSLVLQILLDSTHLSVALMWVARSSAPASALALSAGRFGLAFSVAFGADPACRNELPVLTAGPIRAERAAPKQAQHLI